MRREAVETQASEWATYLVKKLTNKDEVALLKEPVPNLTPLFFEDLNKIAKKRSILLCFENFEATRQELQEWLMKLREYELSPNIRLVINYYNERGLVLSYLGRYEEAMQDYEYELKKNPLSFYLGSLPLLPLLSGVGIEGKDISRRGAGLSPPTVDGYDGQPSVFLSMGYVGGDKPAPLREDAKYLPLKVLPI